MDQLKSCVVAGVLGLMLAATAQAQVVVYGAVPAPLGPSILPSPAYSPVPVVTAYRPVLPSYVAPASYAAAYPVPYAALRPVYPVYPVAPVVVSPTVVTTARLRPVVVAPGIGGYPNLYVPGQPLRNALRYVVP